MTIDEATDALNRALDAADARLAEGPKVRARIHLIDCAPPGWLHWQRHSERWRMWWECDGAMNPVATAPRMTRVHIARAVPALAAEIASRADGQVRDIMEATAALMAWVEGQD